MNWFARIVMGLLGLVFLASLLAALGLYTVFATLRWLLTGRKPQVVMVWQQFAALRKQFHESRAGGRHPRDRSAPRDGPSAFGTGFERQNQADIVDVEVREVVEDAPRLPKN